MSKIIGKYKIEVKKVKEVYGHDDSFPYIAELWDKRKAYCIATMMDGVEKH